VHSSSSHEHIERLGYRPELNGLRALSVLAVAVFHTNLGILQGGWLGVDLFFVLSGFLITTLLLEERDENGIRLGAFYARRALRLLPALAALLGFLMLLVTVGAASSSTTRDVPWVLSYIANWRPAVGGGRGPLTHLWSLSVEEQFYVVWPLVLVGLLRASVPARRLVIGLAGVAGTIAIVRTGLFIAHVITPERAYFGSDVRADALLAGCLLAVVRHAGWASHIERYVRTLLWPAVAGLVVIAFVHASPFARTGPLLFGPVDGAALVVVAGLVLFPHRFRALRWRPLVELGKLSYAFYLWHVPVMVVFGMSPVLRLVLGLPLTLVASIASRFLVEQPMLRWKRRFERTTAAGGDDGARTASTESLVVAPA
jgi:peptidoglycan/LPS O-acetylase OafA/YrhL